MAGEMVGLPDDGEPVTEEWLREIGGALDDRRKVGLRSVVFDDRNSEVPTNGVEFHFDAIDPPRCTIRECDDDAVRIPFPANRRLARMLFEVMGVKTKEA